jgi:hypothetical protein
MEKDEEIDSMFIEDRIPPQDFRWIQLFLWKYGLDKTYEFIHTGKTGFLYIEKGVKFKGTQVIYEKMSIGLLNFKPEDRLDILKSLFNESETYMVDRFEEKIEELEKKGYEWDKRIIIYGKELEGTIWKPEIYYRLDHEDITQCYGISFDMHTLDMTHYYFVCDIPIKEIEDKLQSFCRSIDEKQILHRLLEKVDVMRDKRSYLYKSDERYIFSMYVSFFIDYSKVRQEVRELVYLFSNKFLEYYEPDPSQFPMLALIHFSQEKEKDRQITVYFRTLL